MDEFDPEKNPFDSGTDNPGYDETSEMTEMDRFPPTSSRRGSEDITGQSFRGRYVETSFGGRQVTLRRYCGIKKTEKKQAGYLKINFLIGILTIFHLALL